MEEDGLDTSSWEGDICLEEKLANESPEVHRSSLEFAV
jgi:hypothetical protein